MCCQTFLRMIRPVVLQQFLFVSFVAAFIQNLINFLERSIDMNGSFYEDSYPHIVNCSEICCSESWISK